MDSEELRRKIAQQENAKLDFKFEMYKIYEPKSITQEERERHWGEFVKDVLSLANGNIGTAEETGYLIIGAHDVLNADSTRYLRDVGDKVPTRKDIFNKVSSFCKPHFLDVYCETVLLDGKRLFVVSIPPSPYLYRLKKQLKTPKKNFLHTQSFFVRGLEETYTRLTMKRKSTLKENYKC